jgi:hypothetical protein
MTPLSLKSSEFCMFVATEEKSYGTSSAFARLVDPNTNTIEQNTNNNLLISLLLLSLENTQSAPTARFFGSWR